MRREPEPQRSCPDDGRCWHSCAEQGTGCFRVQYCGPFSNTYPGDTWPDEIRKAEGATTPGTTASMFGRLVEDERTNP